MVILITDTDRVELDDELADYSTYIRSARSFSITTTGKNEVDVRDISSKIGEYITYLRTGSVSIDDEMSLLLEWMGHINPRSNKKRKRLYRWSVYLTNTWYTRYVDRLVELDGLYQVKVIRDIYLDNDVSITAIVGQLALLTIGVEAHPGHLSRSNTYYTDNISTPTYYAYRKYYKYVPIHTVYDDIPLQKMIYGRKEKEQIVYLPSQRRVYCSHLLYHKIRRRVGRYRYTHVRIPHIYSYIWSYAHRCD